MFPWQCTVCYMTIKLHLYLHRTHSASVRSWSLFPSQRSASFLSNIPEAFLDTLRIPFYFYFYCENSYITSFNPNSVKRNCKPYMLFSQLDVKCDRRKSFSRNIGYNFRKVNLKSRRITWVLTTDFEDTNVKINLKI